MEISLTCVEVASSADGIDVEGGSDSTIVPMLLITISQDPSVTKAKNARTQNDGSRRRSMAEPADGLSTLLCEVDGNRGLRSSTFEACSVSLIEIPAAGVLILNAPNR